MSGQEYPEGLVNWLADGRRGVSSNTIVQHLTGLRTCSSEFGTSHPHDPADLDRCLLLLERVPALRPMLPQMRTCSPYWAALIDRWDEIESSHLEEVGLGWTKSNYAPKTYDLMAKVLADARTTMHKATGEQA